MGFTSLAEAEGKLRSLGYEYAFQAAFPNSSQTLSAEHYGVAIEAYEATLTTPGPFDAYLQGDDEALSAQAQKGLALFLDTGCAGCHHGPLLGGNSVQTFGIFGRYWEATGSEQIDIGLAHQTQKAEDNYRFRVPMLRNIALTAPYFHDGSVRTLSEAVDIMARLQLSTTLAPEDIGALGAFLETLSGETPPHFAPPD
jgi:cytochrome c peroxidase